MSIGDKVKYSVDNMEYLGLIVARDTEQDLYFVSVNALGKVVESDGSDIEAL